MPDQVRSSGITDLETGGVRGTAHPTLAGLAEQIIGLDPSLDLRQRSNLIELDRHLHRQWGLGKNFVLAWTANGAEVLLLVVPHYRIADYALNSQSGIPGAEDPESEAHAFVTRLLSGSRRFAERQLTTAARLLGATPVRIQLRHALSDTLAETRLIDRLIRRYSVSYASSRGVAPVRHRRFQPAESLRTNDPAEQSVALHSTRPTVACSKAA